ncbi:hypothetical protein JW898_01335 [Candidatus Woesearchaeota archaeon]|nr:hypothetical protein [Candidatus Woesearchaeota archaeon]
MVDVFIGRKAQITVFIIIGIIILFSVGIFSYMKYSGVSPVSILQPKAPPVVEFVDACIERTAVEAIKAMGDQGGYIVIPPGIAYNPTRHVSLVPGVGGEFAPKVPYWYFDGKTEIPSLRYMEVEVEHYIDTNLKYCLDSFSAMRDEYIITELSNYSSSVVFTDRETIIGLDYVIDIQPRGKDETTRREQFVVKLDVPLKRMWELAKEILEAENRMTFYENMTLNIMASHPSEDIPFTGMEFHCGRLQWLLSNIKKKVIYAVEPAVSAVRFKNTDHPPFMAKDDAYRAVHNAVAGWKESEVYKPLVLPKNIPEDSYDYFQYYFQFTENDRDYRAFKVVSSFKEDWGMNLLATPNQYGVLKSGVQDLKSQIMGFLCLNTYHFVYDLTYPVMVSINDPNALHRTGYVFRFAFPVQIFHNNPDRSLLPTRIIEPTEFALNYCDYYAPEDHTIIARDVVTNAELSKVNLTFRCLREQCILGTTRSDNRHLQWSGKFPDGCAGALIEAYMSGYVLAEKQYDGTEPFYIDMYPTQPVVFDVKRHPENSPDTSKFLAPDMYAILQLDLREPRIPGSLTVFDVFGQQDIFNRTDTFELLRADAVYDINLMLMQKISKDEDRMIGGWIGNWTVKLGEILDAKKVVFHIPQKVPTPRTDEEVIAVYELMTNRSLFPDIKPEIIRADEYAGEQDAAGTEEVAG